MSILARAWLVAFAMAAVVLSSVVLPEAAFASAPALQVTPLQYEDTLADTIKSGHIDVANPTDATVNVTASVSGFDQTGDNGDLRFTPEAFPADAISVDLKSFVLGPRESVRVLFSVNPKRLPVGGVYAAIFFRTEPIDGPSNSSYVRQSANVGTLLLLRNGAALAPKGNISRLAIPFWQFGNGLSGSVTVQNTAPSHGEGIGFRPDLSARVFPWGAVSKQPTGLILPGASRRFELARPGSFLGLLPLTVTDAATHSSRTAWVFACTGVYAWLMLVIALALLILGILRRLRVLGRPWRTRHSRAQNSVSIPSALPVTGRPDPAALTIMAAKAAAPAPGTVIVPRPVIKIKPKLAPLIKIMAKSAPILESKPKPHKVTLTSDPKPEPNSKGKPKAKLQSKLKPQQSKPQPKPQPQSKPQPKPEPRPQPKPHKVRVDPSSS